MRIVLDAMGGDFAPLEPVKGAILAIKEHPDLEIVLVGQEKRIKEFLPEGTERIYIKNAGEVISSHELPSVALKSKRDSSIGVGIRYVREKEADAFVSAGNTGAVMAFSLFTLGRLKGVKRPALATFFPSMKGHTLVLDVGANSDSKPLNLFQFGIMASIYMNKVYNISEPSIGLLSMGAEKTKGSNLTSEVYGLFSNSPLNFYGNIEGDDILKGTVDIAICDGFTGNAILKFGESLVDFIKIILREEAKKGLFTMLGGILMKPAFRGLMERVNYEEYGGAILLGINGISVVSHGKSKKYAIKNAIKNAYRFYKERVNYVIKEDLERMVR